MILHKRIITPRSMSMPVQGQMLKLTKNHIKSIRLSLFYIPVRMKKGFVICQYVHHSLHFNMISAFVANVKKRLGNPRWRLRWPP